MKTLFTIFFTLALMLPARADLIVELTIENQEVQGTDLFFDIYLTRHADSHGDIYLADMDLVLNFNAQFFTDPVLSPVENGMDDTGQCLFSPTTDLPQAEMDCRAEYFAKTATTAIEGNHITINLLGPEPPDATAFDGLIAWVDGQPTTHRLGRFKISGINDQMGTAGLVWAETQAGTMTKVFSFQNFAPWGGQPVEVMATQPPDVELDSVISSTNEIWANNFLIENIYPNPATDILYVEMFLSKNETVFFEISDLTGRIFWKNKMELFSGENILPIEINNLPSGNYQLNIKGEKGSEAVSFLKY